MENQKLNFNNLENYIYAACGISEEEFGLLENDLVDYYKESLVKDSYRQQKSIDKKIGEVEVKGELLHFEICDSRFELAKKAEEIIGRPLTIETYFFLGDFISKLIDCTQDILEELYKEGRL